MGPMIRVRLLPGDSDRQPPHQGRRVRCGL